MLSKTCRFFTTISDITGFYLEHKRNWRLSNVWKDGLDLIIGMVQIIYRRQPHEEAQLYIYIMLILLCNNVMK